MMAEMEVLHPGLFCSIQDLGRFGFMEFGVPVGGGMDSGAMKMANLLLKNDENSAVLEITQLGPKLSFSAETQIAFTGALLSPKLNGVAIDNNKLYVIKEGDVLSFGKRKMGCRAYLAIKGGFKTEVVLKSRSWYDGLTSFSKLEKGLKIPYESISVESPEYYSGIKIGESVTSYEIEAYLGPEADKLSAEVLKILETREFTIDVNNNRMGIQLVEAVENSLKPILTGPVLPGTVQLTPSGKLIVLMRDGQTTGGYPRVFQLSEKGINTLAQKVMGEKIKFQLL